LTWWGYGEVEVSLSWAIERRVPSLLRLAETGEAGDALVAGIQEVSAARRRVWRSRRSHRLPRGRHQSVEIYGELRIDVLDDVL